jgi:hypothetical protein
MQSPETSQYPAPLLSDRTSTSATAGSGINSIHDSLIALSCNYAGDNYSSTELNHLKTHTLITIPLCVCHSMLYRVLPCWIDLLPFSWAPNHVLECPTLFQSTLPCLPGIAPVCGSCSPTAFSPLTLPSLFIDMTLFNTGPWSLCREL